MNTDEIAAEASVEQIAELHASEQEQSKLQNSTVEGIKVNEIKAGDIVAVNFNGAQITLCHEAEVIYVPCATGDSWHFRDIRTGDIHYVSEGCTITRKETPPLRPRK